MKAYATLCAAGVVVVLSLISCTKSDLPDPGAAYKRVRLYDDTLPDPRSYSNHMVAGNGRLLMTYGNTNSMFDESGGVFTLPPPSRCSWMLTDNEGNLIRKDTFPTGLSVGGIARLADNSFLVVLHTGFPNMSDWTWRLFLMRLDPNGVPGPVNPLPIPGIDALPFTQIQPILFSTAQSGNAILNFSYTDSLWHGGNFIGEMDKQGNFLWNKLDQSYFINDFAPTPDGGYMALVGFWVQATTSFTYSIMKTSSTFDSSWTRGIGPLRRDGELHIVSAGNGNYRLGYLTQPPGGINYNVLQINAEGEIVDSVTYPIPDVFWNRAVMLPPTSSGMFVLHGMSNANGSITDRFNATYVKLNADLDITRQATFQVQTSDMINSACTTSDGTTACFGITQSYDRRYYKPVLILMD
jgi:hypothetical protein